VPKMFNIELGPTKLLQKLNGAVFLTHSVVHVMSHSYTGAQPGFYMGAQKLRCARIKAPTWCGLGRACPPLQPSVVISPSGVRSGALAANAFFGIFEAHRTLLVERTVLLF